MRHPDRLEVLAICPEYALRPQVLSLVTAQQHIHLREIAQFQTQDYTHCTLTLEFNNDN